MAMMIDCNGDGLCYKTEAVMHVIVVMAMVMEVMDFFL